MEDLLPLPTPPLPVSESGFPPLSPGLFPAHSTYLWGIRAALKTAQVPRSHQKVPESLTHGVRKDLPKNRITNTQATQKLGTLKEHLVQLPLSAGLPKARLPHLA